MQGVDDYMVKEVYDAFKDFAQRELRDGDNPNLSACGFNEVPKATLSHFLFPLTGVRRGGSRVFDQRLQAFRYPGAELAWEEDELGKLKYWVQVPIPRKQKKKKHRHYEEEEEEERVFEEKSPSCTKMLVSIVALMVFTMGSIMLNEGALKVL